MRATCLSGVPPPNINNHCVGTRNHCVRQFTSKNYWKTTLRAPCLSGVPPPPPQQKQPLCVHMEPLCRLIDLKQLCENNFEDPIFIRVPPPNTTKQSLCGHTEPLCRLTHLKTVLENNFQNPMFIRGPPPPNQQNNHCVSTQNHCVSYMTLNQYWKRT